MPPQPLTCSSRDRSCTCSLSKLLAKLLITHCWDTVLPMKGTVAQEAQPRHTTSTSVRAHCQTDTQH